MTKDHSVRGFTSINDYLCLKGAPRPRLSGISSRRQSWGNLQTLSPLALFGLCSASFWGPPTHDKLAYSLVPSRPLSFPITAFAPMPLCLHVVSAPLACPEFTRLWSSALIRSPLWRFPRPCQPQVASPFSDLLEFSLSVTNEPLILLSFPHVCLPWAPRGLGQPTVTRAWSLSSARHWVRN